MDPYAALDRYVAIPRTEALALSPDGCEAVLTVAKLSGDRTRYRRSLWSVPVHGDGPPRRLTGSVVGRAAFSAAGDVLFVSDRRGEDDDDDAPERAQLWRLPAGGGEARALTALAGGVSAVAASARDRERVVVVADLLVGAESVDDDARRRAARRTRKLSAILHDSYPVRFWDHELGPGRPHLLALDLTARDDGLPQAPAHPDGDDEPAPYPDALPAPRDLTPHPGREADISGAVLTPDGSTLYASIQTPRRRAGDAALVAYDTATGERTLLFSEPGVQYEQPVLSHSGTMLAFLRTRDPTPDGPFPTELWVADADGDHARRIAADWDRAAHELAFAADDAALVVSADEGGRTPLFLVALDGGTVRRLTDDAFAYDGLSVDRHSAAIVALRSGVAVAPHPVRVDLDGTVTALATPAPAPAPTATRLDEVQARADDGTPVRGWLLTPEDADAQSPAPLLLWIHGGPVASYSGWSWRWNPLLAVARGYAVLMPDPGLSTGYGLDFTARGWNAWGAEPYRDLMAITDAAAARPEIDATRTGAMGGSFGGYMANWIAGHSDRFDAIVTHASLWSLPSFAGTTDRADYWDHEFTPDGTLENSPHRFVSEIRTPMLVIHGDHDHRVPFGEALALFNDLAAHHASDDGTMAHRFLAFPDESHWILGPQNTVLWYETVFAFLAEHVLGRAWERPDGL